MNSKRGSIGLLWIAVTAVGSSVATAQAKDVAGVKCESPAPSHCADSGCTAELMGNLGNATEPKTGRKFFLDYPCDLKPNEKVVFILSIHGAGAIGNWHRHYFPAMDYKDKYRLVIATPTAGSTAPVAEGQPGIRMWQANVDDEYLHNIVDFVFENFGRKNIKSFWLAGHSQGGMTSNRIVCTDFFKDKVDGWLSLSGGRIGPAPIVPEFFGPGGPPPALSATGGGGDNAPRPGIGVMPSCDISYIFATGEKEIVSLPDTSPIAARYHCGARVRRADIVDDRKGYVTGSAPNRGPYWGREARPGTAIVYQYPKCDGGRLVADVERMDKGHTEGLEPKVTEALIQMIVAAPGGKAQKSK